MNFYCMRHGRTNYNDLGLCNDDPARDVYLTETGIAQAETAEIVNRYHAVPIEVHDDLADIRSGFESQPVADYFAAIDHDPLRARINGGESLLDHKQRVMRFIDWLRVQQDEALLVVVHEETLRVFIAHFEGGIEDAQLRDIHVGNCEYRQYAWIR